VAKRDKTVLHLAQTVDAETDDAVTMIPADGATVVLDKFVGSFTANKTATICVIWDYGGTEIVIDLVANMNIKQLIGTGDGIKKVGLVLSNFETVDTISMSGTAVILEVTDA
jgi:hypothetical protein